jgi:hexosaminidase
MLDTNPILLPVPRNMSFNGTALALSEGRLIVIPSPALLFEAQTIQKAIVEHAGMNWRIVAGGVNYRNVGLRIVVDDALNHPQGYQLHITTDGITIRGNDPAGVYYGVATLSQLLAHYKNVLPTLAITDWPDFPARGVMLDISRDKVPTLQTVYDLVDRLSKWKINQVQLYMEHTFAYQQHPEVWAEASPFTAREVMELDLFCKQRHVELVPNQNSLGHMERWLKFPRYIDLAECPDGFDLPWRKNSPPSSLNPIDPRSIELIASLYDELLPHFSSPLFNVGGDEPWELGECRSKEEKERIGEGRLYLNYVLKLYDVVKQHGRTMMMWDDIIIKYPELIPELPKDLVAMIWGYEADHPFEDRCKAFTGSGVPFYVCPGTSSWNTFAGRTDNALGNLRSAAINGLKYGGIGFLNTDWGDRGHWQPLPVSYTGFAYGAAISWAQTSNLDIDLPRALSRLAFEDSAGVMGKLAYDLGNVYLVHGHAWFNSHGLHMLLQGDLVNKDQWVENFHKRGGEDPIESFNMALEMIDRVMQPLDTARINRADATLIKEEFRTAADLMRFACRRGLAMFGDTSKDAAAIKGELPTLIERYKTNWMARNRSGGLADSVARFDNALND